MWAQTRRLVGSGNIMSSAPCVRESVVATVCPTSFREAEYVGVDVAKISSFCVPKRARRF